MKNIYPLKKVFFFLGFPFDPLSETPCGYDKQRYLSYSVDFKKFFAIDEFLLSNELWDFLSGDTNTMQQLLDLINKIAPQEFLSKYDLSK